MSRLMIGDVGKKATLELGDEGRLQKDGTQHNNANEMIHITNAKGSKTLFVDSCCRLQQKF